MLTIDDVKLIWKRFCNFISETAYDFAECWSAYPNVLIWCGVAFLIALFV